MKSNKRNIGSLILLFFLTFPIVFQSIHLLQHHHRQCEHECLSIQAKSDVTQPFEMFKTQDEHKGCPVCNYTFTPFSSPQKVSLNTVSFVALNLHAGYYTNNTIFYSGTHHQLRAPPVASNL